MPWVVTMEIAKQLKVGGLVFVETHMSFVSVQSSHLDSPAF